MRNMLLLLCTLVAALGIRESLACSCQPEHPSQQFCRADFVIKAKVVSKLEIYPTDKPVFEPTTKPEDPKPLPPGYDIEPEFPQVHQPDTLPQLGGTLRMPGGGLLPPSGGIQALGGMLGGGMFPGPVIPGASEVRPIELEYSIKVDKIFKTNLDVKLDPKTTAKIYTAPWDGMCGVSWLVNGETYLLTGSYYDDKLRISTCNWIDLYDDLTRRQKRGVKAAYKADCYERDDKNACQICFYDGCTELKKDSCIWDAFSPYEDCESLHSRCKRNTKGKCQWERKREYRKCDVQRKTEQIDTTPFDL